MSKSESTSKSSAPATDPTYIPSTDTTSFIETSGGLLTEQTILSLRQERFDHPAAKPETFVLPGEDPPTQNELEERIALVWEDLVERWDEVTQRGRLFEMDISEARSKWILKLFQTLDFEPVYQRSNLEVEGMKFDLSHKGWPDDEIEDFGNMGGARAPLIHTIEPETERDLDRENKLDRKPKGAERGASSPHDTLQSFLNASQDHNWGIVTDGVTLRVLRDYYHTYTRGYVEFDLENIFTSRNYQDFRALYRLCHPSRFIPRNKDTLDKPLEEVLKDDRDTSREDEETNISTPLEMLYQTSLSTGVKVGQDLQSNVISALETLGNGLLNPEIREFLRKGGEEEAQEYYQELLMIIYRLLFLLYAEQRGMMPGRDSLYIDEYSITKLRQRAERRRSQGDTNTDLWYGLRATFKLAQKGNEELGVPAYNGMLFDPENLTHISESECTNKALLSAIADLTLIEQDGVLQRISYADLGVEEVGSIYESLLEFTPRLAEERLDIDGETVHAGDFYLDSRGLERRETGSYYTNTKLVQELIESTLEPVVDDRLANADNTKEAKEAALLDISVVDPACGSAAFLIAATNYLGQRLAEIREEMKYPLEDDVRDARRSVLQHCIYGVDLNPMAVELAKVSLWIDSAVKDKPLSFLDHHIRCGNSVVGTTDELVNNGLPDDAYETSGGRDWHVGNDLRARVRKENQKVAKGIGSHSLASFKGGLEKQASLIEQLSDTEERTVEDVERKGNIYKEIRENEMFQQEERTFDVWTAAFFWPMRKGEAAEYPTPETIHQVRRRPYEELSTDLQQMVDRAEEISEEHRFFHWELEFPEVFSGEDSGFDCILGNPPFIAGGKIGSHLGSRYMNWLQFAYSPFGGKADLCAVFFRRSFNLLRPDGRMGMIGTNSIGQGDTRENGLAVILEEDGIITFARRFVKWIGAASVEVNLLTVHKEGQSSLDTLPDPILDGESVEFISSRLDEEPEIEPTELKLNEDKAFQGDILRGSGFVLEPEEAKQLINSNPRNEDCLYPYLNGQDLNSHPTQNPSRYVICFQDWELDRAKKYPDLLDIVEERVKPERQKLENKSDRRDKKYWWRFARYRDEMRQAIESQRRVLVRSSVSELHSLAFVPNEYIFSHATVVFAFDDDYHFALLQSNLHELWLRKQASSLRTDIRYTPSTCFDTFPFPKEENHQKESGDWQFEEMPEYFSRAGRLGAEYRNHRSQIMSDRNIGLTDTYNLYHDPECTDTDIERLRKLHAKMDQAILTCYGWENLNPEHGFYENEREGQTRFTFSPQAQRETRKRLLELNHELSKKEIEK